jgi:hypothetical protein
MTIILGNAVLLFFYSMFFRENRKFVAILGGFQLFLLLALRSEYYGTDALYYVNGYDYISSMTFEQMLGSLNSNLLNTAHLVYPYSYENGWVLLNWLFSASHLGYRALMVFLSGVTAVSFGLFAYRFSKDPGITMFVLSCLSPLLYSFFILRQTFALCICLLALPFLLKRRPIPFALMVVVAFLFHRSALLFLILYPLCGRRATKKVFQVGLVVFAIFLAASYTVLPKVVALLFELVAKTHFQIDFSWNDLIALQLLIVVCCLFFDIDDISKDPADNLSLWAILASLLTYTVMLNNDVLARANEYLWIFVALLIPAILQRIEPEMRALLRMVVGILLLGFLVYKVQGSDLDPYISVFGQIGGR